VCGQYPPQLTAGVKRGFQPKAPYTTSHCIWRRTSTHAVSTCVNVWRRTLTPDTADAKLYATYHCCQLTQLHCHQMPYGDGRQCNTSCHAASVDVRRRSMPVCVNAAVETSVLDYNVAAHQRHTTLHAVQMRLKPCVSCVACIRLETGL